MSNSNKNIHNKNIITAHRCKCVYGRKTVEHTTIVFCDCVYLKNKIFISSAVVHEKSEYLLLLINLKQKRTLKDNKSEERL